MTAISTPRRSSQFVEEIYEDGLSDERAVNRPPAVQERQAAEGKVDQVNDQDLNEAIDLEKADSPTNYTSKSASEADLPYLAPAASSARNIIAFEPNDPGNPHNWSRGWKYYCIFISIITVLNSTLNSSLSSNASRPMGEDFGVTGTEKLILPTSIYLLGYVVGPTVWGPMSEQYGRRWIMISAFAIFTIFSLAVALSPNFGALVIFRLFVGTAAAAPIAIVGGTCADIYNTPRERGTALAFFASTTVLGPCISPSVSGYVSTISWRWSYWIGLIFAGVSWLPLIFVPETHAPTILKYRAQKMRRDLRKHNPESTTAMNAMPYAAIELGEQDFRHIVTVVLTRPIRMFLTEALVFFSCLYMAVAYGIFYLFLVAYPIIFEGVYGFSPGQEGLTFFAIAVGSIFSFVIYLSFDAYLWRALHKDAKWSRSNEAQRLPLACAAGPFFVISCFWLAWTARADVHWIVPTLSGIPFGIGYLLLFMALQNYLVDAYKIFAASAMAAGSTTRSIFGVVLPFATKSMFDTLGIAWACSLLGFISVAMSIIPFIFIWKGDKIRARSRFCQHLAEREREEEAKAQRRAERARVQALAESAETKT